MPSLPSASRAAFVTRALFGVALLMLPHASSAQYLTRPERRWETIETPHFRVHYPAEMHRWVLPVAERLESMAAAVNALVGHTPDRPVTVMVEDPSNVSNGFALPLREAPVIFLWPTPPAPSPSFGDHRGWGELLSVHEYGHIAHLTIPTRNSRERMLWRLLPAQVGPVARKSPAWVIEGYATYLEGRLTGNGRPHSAGRAAILRQWALEGRLPSYAQLGATGPFLGGAMRYLVGSAFLEWLAERKGDESLTHVWRRMSARERRSFAEAFRGVFGAGPDDLYGAFTTDVMEKALEARRTLRAAGTIEGELVQRRLWATGEPALSPDGHEVAVVVRTSNRPPRLEVWSATDDRLDSGVVRARARMLARDSLDVLPFDSFPPPRRARRTLHPVGGRSHETPRWFPDGERILVSRSEPLGDGATRPDLFEWHTRRGTLRRITKGAGIRSADPSPDGRSAVGVRCEGGVCDLVRIDLSDGHWVVLSAGSPRTVWHRPRWSADSKRIAASVQREGRWWAFVVDATDGTAHPVDPGDGANRYAPTWTPDGQLVVVSERGGIPNLELLDPETAEPRTLTRVVGAVAAPDVGPDGRVWYLSLHAKGYDVRRLSLDASAATTAPADPVQLGAHLVPVAPRPREAGVVFPARSVAPATPYGFGPRAWRALPGVSLAPDGDMLSVMVANTDPIGRLSVVAQGGYGVRGAWSGGAMGVTLRRLPVTLEGSVWHTAQSPSAQEAGSLEAPGMDATLRGVGVTVRHERELGTWAYDVRAGGSAGQLALAGGDAVGRALAYVELGGGPRWTWRNMLAIPRLSLHVAEGTTGGDRWRRTLAGASVSVGGSQRWFRTDGLLGWSSAVQPGDGERVFEQFVVGGSTIPFVDPAYLSQRFALPAVPVGFAAGQRLGMGRVSARVASVAPWFMWIGAGDTPTRAARIVGVEEVVEFRGIGFARMPGVRVRVGAGYSLDAPYAERLRPYVSVTYRP